MSLDSPSELEEERRLLYVATTRAKHNLVVVAPQSHLDRRLGQVPVRSSRFFEEIPTGVTFAPIRFDQEGQKALTLVLRPHNLLLMSFAER